MIKVAREGVNYSIIFKRNEYELASMKITVLGVLDSIPLYEDQARLSLLANNGVPVRLHLFIVQPDNRYYHVSTIDDQLRFSTADEKLLTQQAGSALYNKVSANAMLSFRRWSTVTNGYVFYMAVPL